MAYPGIAMALTDHPAYRVVSEHARALGSRIGLLVASDLKRMREPLLSGDDTCLTSVWEEICVQVQGEESHFWGAYAQIMRDQVLARLQEVSRPELEMLWLRTESGWDWLWDVVNAEKGEAPPHPGIDEDAVAQWIVQDFIKPLAEEYESNSVSRFLRRT